MRLQTPNRCFLLTRASLLAAALGSTLCFAAAGCGAGVANTVPSALPAVKGLPSGPVLGYIFSATDGTLRPILGVRGSAQVGTSIVPAGVYVAGEASTAGSSGLLEDSSGSLFAFNLPASQPIHILDHFAGRAQIVFASSGTTAIAYAAGGSTIALITGLPSSAQVRNIVISSATPLDAAIVSDAGTVVMQSGGAVGVMGATGQFSPLATVSSAGGMNFIPGSDDVLIADRTANTLSWVRNVSTSPSLQTLNAAGVNQPVAVAASKDKHWAVVANGGDQSVVRVDLTTGSAATKLACACQPSQLTALAGGGSFRVNALGSGPVWTLDVSGSTPQLLFVPAMQ